MNKQNVKDKRMAIYYMSPDIDYPIGGVKVIYQHVDLLNQMGYEAYVVHSEREFRCTWFENNTPICCSPNINIDDIVVVPEIMANKLFGLSCRKIILNQNVYYIPNKIGKFAPNSYLIKDLEKVIVVSKDNYYYLKKMYPNLNIAIVRNSIDSKKFSYEIAKKKQVAYMSRKNAAHVEKIVSQLQVSQDAKEWSFVDINQVSENQVASILKKTSIFISTGHPEGFGLPIAEALACGCKVIGYDGMGGRELFEQCEADSVEYGNIGEVVHKVEEHIRILNKGYNSMMRKVDSDFILNYYSSEMQKRDLGQVY